MIAIASTVPQTINRNRNDQEFVHGNTASGRSLLYTPNGRRIVGVGLSFKTLGYVFNGRPEPTG